MKRKIGRNQYLRQLRNGKLKLSERICLYCCGKRDGKLQIIKEEDEYTSPFISQETHLFLAAIKSEQEVFAKKILYAQEQIELAKIQEHNKRNTRGIQPDINSGESTSICNRCFGLPGTANQSIRSDRAIFFPARLDCLWHKAGITCLLAPCLIRCKLGKLPVSAGFSFLAQLDLLLHHPPGFAHGVPIALP